MKFIRAGKGKNKKCIVLDCDNTLWGGVVGEDGLDGIKLSSTYPGNVYVDFQRQVLNLYQRGILIALCSKNNEEDVMRVIHNHPDMILREEHIAAYQINWDDKATNIKRLAEQLNIGLDSFVFVDDNPFEVNLIQKAIPEVETILLTEFSLTEYPRIIKKCGLFDTLVISEEDKKRGQMYKEEAKRKSLAVHATSIQEYLESLEMEVEISLVNSFAIPRVAQLTQKTNQFNLTTKRYSEEDIGNFATSSGFDVLYLKLKDRFGDMGIVGVAILEYKDQSCWIDSFLLSCRVLGREVENLFLGACLELAKKKKMYNVYGVYVKTRKNSQVEHFFAKRQFAIHRSTEESVEYVLAVKDIQAIEGKAFKAIKKEF